METKIGLLNFIYMLVGINDLSVRIRYSIFACMPAKRAKL